MKKLIGMILSIFLILLLTAAALDQTRTKTYVNDDFGFSIEHPESWADAKVQGGNVVVLFIGGAMNRNIQVIYDKGGEEAGKAALENLAKILRIQKELVAEWREINGQRAFYQDVEWESLIGRNRAIRLMIPTDDSYFLIMGVCPANEYDELKPILEKCVLSFRLTDFSAFAL